MNMREEKRTKIETNCVDLGVKCILWILIYHKHPKALKQFKIDIMK